MDGDVLRIEKEAEAEYLAQEQVSILFALIVNHLLIVLRAL